MIVTPSGLSHGLPRASKLLALGNTLLDELVGSHVRGTAGRPRRADSRGTGAVFPAAGGDGRPRRRRRLRLGGAGRAAAAGAAGGGRALRPVVRHRAGGRDAVREHTPLRPRPARQQRPALGCPRHGQELAGQGDPCAAERSCAASAGADRDPPRGHREPAAPAPSPRGQRAALPAFLRRPLLRRRRDQLQVAQGRARGGDRGQARQCPVLRHLQPPPPDAAPDDRQRAQHRHPSRRGGRGEGVAVRPVRPLAGLPPLQPGHLSGHGRALRRAFPLGDRRARNSAAKRWNGPRPAAAGRAVWRGS